MVTGSWWSRTRRDGVAESSHARSGKEIHLPGIAVIDNRIIVSQSPDLIVYTDANRNAVFDEGWTSRGLAHRVRREQPRPQPPLVTVGPNGQYYFNHGTKERKSPTRKAGNSTQEVFILRETVGLPSGDGQVYAGGVAPRVNPDGTGLRPIGHNFQLLRTGDGSFGTPSKTTTTIRRPAGRLG